MSHRTQRRRQERRKAILTPLPGCGPRCVCRDCLESRGAFGTLDAPLRHKISRRPMR